MKTRHLSLYDFLQRLQCEYVIASLRKKIYTKPKDKRYFERVMKHKREKIEDIALRNGLPSIFDTEEERLIVEAKIYPENGFPNFEYRDELEKAELRPKDVQYYYMKGAEVKVLGEDGKLTIGKIEENPTIDPMDDNALKINPVSVKLRESEEPRVFLAQHVTRILGR